MLILGLAGPAGAGKDTVADYLVARYGFVKFAFSDALYMEVQRAFSLDNQLLMRDRMTKELPSERFAPEKCRDPRFVRMLERMFPADFLQPWTKFSPRKILQLWGTEYRRAEDSNYWLDRAGAFISSAQSATFYPEQAPQHFVEVGTRFENEREWIKSLNGNVWHIHRGDDTTVDPHASAAPLPVQPRERQLWNNDTIERLQRGVDLLFNTTARFVRVEPMAKDDASSANN